MALSCLSRPVEFSLLGERRWPSPNFPVASPPPQPSRPANSQLLHCPAAAAGAIIVIATIRSLNLLALGFSFFVRAFDRQTLSRYKGQTANQSLAFSAVS